MLEKIRESAQGPWAMVVIALIVLSFVFAGVGSYLTGSTDDSAAVVNGDPISVSTLERAYQNERARIENQFGEGVAGLFANPEYLQEFRAGVLDKLIGDKLVEQKARELGLRVSDQQIRDAIRMMPEFQVGGQFNNDRYLAIVQQAGFQPNSFRDYLRAEMTREQLARALTASEFALPEEVSRTNQLQGQTRDIQLVNISADDFAQGVEVTADEINAYYQANLNQYDTQERVALAFVDLRVDDLVDEVSVSDEEVTEYYALNERNYLSEEQRRVSHILVEFGEDESAAKAQAEALLERVQGGEDFAAIAEAESADTFSAENGGDLDFISRGIMDESFEAAAFELNAVGDVSDVVESEFGFHIIKLTDIKPEVVTPLEDVRAEIVAELKRDKAMELYFARQQSMAELAFEIPDTLTDVAGAVGGTVQETALFTRDSAPAIVNFPQVTAIAFSEELIEDRVNSDVIEINDERVMVVRVIKHEAERTKSLDEVSEQIESQLAAEKAQQQALEFADNLLAKVKEGSEIDDELAEKSLSWEQVEKLNRFDSSIGSNVVEQAFMLGLGSGESATTVAKADGNVALIQLVDVHAPQTLESAQSDALKERLAQSISQSNYQSFVSALRSEADVVISAR
ncbi:SurA N-terminal domain-containing protein [Alteromonas oceanisediminis]|uniref:SurA N-terminal domain-containing protein n=1 Tax=Alteromonas oceanisediminis TaxID=2836180 RepID=UPI001BDB10E2|nr:SurA N-terminal domain-containing protein [Alteromonas oceanisediminis]MBT0585769.1 SurA N-terminal domain-containing protein [Alteromonas oceanisediminis]